MRCGCTACCDDLLLPGNSVSHHPLDGSASPVLVRLHQIDYCLCATHTVCGFGCGKSSGVPTLEPAIRERLHAIQDLFLVFPKAVGVFTKRSRKFGSREKYSLRHRYPLLSNTRSWHWHVLPPWRGSARLFPAE